jgi:hypothetical protein
MFVWILYLFTETIVRVTFTKDYVIFIRNRHEAGT